MVPPLATIAQAAQGFPKTAEACLRPPVHEPAAFVRIRDYCIPTKRLVGPWNGENLFVPVVEVPGLHGPMPDVPLLETLARLQSKSATREIPEEHHVGRRGVAGVTMRIAL